MTQRPDTRCFNDPIGNASGWRAIDFSLRETGRGTAGAPVYDGVQALPAAGQRTIGGSIRPVFAAERGTGGPAETAET